MPGTSGIYGFWLFLLQRHPSNKDQGSAQRNPDLPQSQSLHFTCACGLRRSVIGDFHCKMQLQSFLEESVLVRFSYDRDGREDADSKVGVCVSGRHGLCPPWPPSVLHPAFVARPFGVAKSRLDPCRCSSRCFLGGPTNEPTTQCNRRVADRRRQRDKTDRYMESALRKKPRRSPYPLSVLTEKKNPSIFHVSILPSMHACMYIDLNMDVHPNKKRHIWVQTACAVQPLPLPRQLLPRGRRRQLEQSLQTAGASLWQGQTPKGHSLNRGRGDQASSGCSSPVVSD